jgi:hypothetical protein
MIRLPAHPLPSSPVSKLPVFLSFPVYRRSSLLTGEGIGLGANSYRPRESLALCKSFNTLLFRLPAAVQQMGAERGIAVEQVLAEVDDQLVRVPQGRLYNRPVRHSSVARDCACATHREMIHMDENPGSSIPYVQ